MRQAQCNSQVIHWRFCCAHLTQHSPLLMWFSETQCVSVRLLWDSLTIWLRKARMQILLHLTSQWFLLLTLSVSHCVFPSCTPTHIGVKRLNTSQWGPVSLYRILRDWQWTTGGDGTISVRFSNSCIVSELTELCLLMWLGLKSYKDTEFSPAILHMQENGLFICQYTKQFSIISDSKPIN